MIAQKESEEKAEFARATPPPEIVSQMVEEAKTVGTPEYKQDGTMTFEFFLQTSKIVQKYVIL